MILCFTLKGNEVQLLSTNGPQNKQEVNGNTAGEISKDIIVSSHLQPEVVCYQ